MQRHRVYCGSRTDAVSDRGVGQIGRIVIKRHRCGFDLWCMHCGGCANQNIRWFVCQAVGDRFDRELQRTFDVDDGSGRVGA